MRGRRILTIQGCILIACAFALAAPTGASEAIAEQEALDCMTCHPDEEDHLLLTDQGHYYQLAGTLEGFEVVLEQFGSCTYCHVREAGSSEMTREGQRFQWMMQDMVGLRAWLEERHPRPASESEPEEGAEKSEEPDAG